MKQTIAARLVELGIVLPEPPRPVASYIPAVRAGNLVFISGQLPFINGKLEHLGPVPSACSKDAAIEAARQCGLNALAILAGELDGELDRVQRIVRLGVFVQSDPTYGEQPAIGNGASNLMQEIFGEAGRHARAAVGVPALPLNASVEIEMIAEVRD